MKKLILFAALFIACLSLSAQKIALDDGSTTRAVVIGISDYQDEGIPDLRFADKDANAEEQFKKVLQLDPTNAPTYYNLGNIYADAGRYPEAEEQQYKKAIQLDATFLYAMEQLMILYTITGRFELAEQQFKEVVQLGSTNSAFYAVMGNVYSANRRYADAELQFKKAISLNASNSNAYYSLACVYSLQSQPDKAFEQLEQAFKNGWSDYKTLQQDSDIARLRTLPKWDKLMKKYFAKAMND